MPNRRPVLLLLRPLNNGTAQETLKEEPRRGDPPRKIFRVCVFPFQGEQSQAGAAAFRAACADLWHRLRPLLLAMLPPLVGCEEMKFLRKWPAYIFRNLSMTEGHK
jgi:hypothetical protein